MESNWPGSRRSNSMARWRMGIPRMKSVNRAHCFEALDYSLAAFPLNKQQFSVLYSLIECLLQSWAELNKRWMNGLLVHADEKHRCPLQTCDSLDSLSPAQRQKQLCQLWLGCSSVKTWRQAHEVKTKTLTNNVKATISAPEMARRRHSFSEINNKKNLHE